jgi:hypothetical protein
MAAMRSVVKESTGTHYKKLSKIVLVANPALGPDWLKEVLFKMIMIDFQHDKFFCGYIESLNTCIHIFSD